jgi:hypothetical protein
MEIGGSVDYSKYLRDRAAEMNEFMLTAPEPASSEFFTLAALCRDGADRIERQSHRGRPWLVSPSQPRPSAAERRAKQADDTSDQRLPSPLPLC